MIGTLQHASTDVKPGRTFLRRMIDLSKRNVHRRVNTDFYADLQWWTTFIDSWNRVSVLSSLCRRPIDAKLRCIGILVVRGLLRQQYSCCDDQQMDELQLSSDASTQMSSGQFLTRAHFVAEVQKALGLSGVDSSDFTMVTAFVSAANGFEDSLIRTLGRCERDAYRR